MSRKIVICCDGTGQKLDLQRTNVVRLFSVLDRADPDAQICSYDPGVGTMPATGALTWVSRRFTLWAGLWVGFGLLENVSRAYGFIVDRYKEGDSIYLFGFSRGAFTVRVLAALLHQIGVLRPEATNLIPYALELCKLHLTLIDDPKQREETRRIKDEFRNVFSRPGRVDIKFLGLWDTVKAFGILRPTSLPHTRHNPDVVTVRHALALDEQRRSFLPTSWGGLDGYVEQPAPAEQNVKEVWFAGSHSDVGGGYREEESGLSWISLKWMIGEARRSKLRLDEDRIRTLFDHPLNSSQPMDLDEPFWKLHPSRDLGWRAADLVPRPEISNAPKQVGDQRKLPEPGLSVPVGWPKRPWIIWPTTGRRDVEHSRRQDKILMHTSVREMVATGKYTMPVDEGLVSYVEDAAP